MIGALAGCAKLAAATFASASVLHSIGAATASLLPHTQEFYEAASTFSLPAASGGSTPAAAVSHVKIEQVVGDEIEQIISIIAVMLKAARDNEADVGTAMAPLSTASRWSSWMASISRLLLAAGTADPTGEQQQRAAQAPMPSAAGAHMPLLLPPRLLPLL
jgi:hypothetical protein